MNRIDDTGLESDDATSGVESTAVLLGRLRTGDRAARERLFARSLPLLQRWAHRRLPRRARDIADTDDLVQVALLKAFHRIGEFESRREGAFLAYLRTILLNAVRDELRRATRLPEVTELDEQMVEAEGPSILDELIGRDKVRRYEKALERLTEDQREAVILRVEFGMSHGEVAEAMGKPSADAARMAVARALVHLTRALAE